MKTWYYMNFPDGKRLRCETNRDERPPIHTNIHFPTHHPEVQGYLVAFVENTTEYLEEHPTGDHWVIDLRPSFDLDLQTFLTDQQKVGRFSWMQAGD
jgi:hypothetical protein